MSLSVFFQLPFATLPLVLRALLDLNFSILSCKWSLFLWGRNWNSVFYGLLHPFSKSLSHFSGAGAGTMLHFWGYLTFRAGGLVDEGRKQVQVSLACLSVWNPCRWTTRAIWVPVFLDAPQISKHILANFKNYQLFISENMNPDGIVAWPDYC